MDLLQIPSLKDTAKAIGVGRPDPAFAFRLSGGNLASALSLVEYLTPSFETVEGATMRAGSLTDADREEQAATVREWVAKFDGDMSAVEKMVNHEHVLDDLASGADDDEVPGTHLYELAEFVRGSWDRALAVAFPGRTFVAENTMRDVEDDPIVTFYEVRAPDPRTA